MAIDIIGIRGDGDVAGEPIVDPLIGSVACALERARNTLDGASRVVVVSDIEQLYDGAVRTGQLHQKEDFTRAIISKSKVIGVTHTVSKPSDTDAINIDTSIRTMENQ